MIRLKHIYKSYNNTTVLNDINLCLPSKGLISIVGTSGSGKSTLLNLLGGIDKPSKGKIFINNNELTAFNNKDLEWYYDKFIAFIFQSYNLIDYLTVEDNLKLVSNKYNHVLKKLNIYHLKDKKVSLLSGGEKQRVAIARGLIKNSKMLLCDEPTGALDNNTSIVIMNILKEVSKERLVIMVTHNMELANKYSDYILHIKDGHIESVPKINDDTFNMKITRNKFRNVYKIILNHLLNKKKRNILISLSFAIGLIALSFVLSISNGFKKSIDIEEKNRLSLYPIVISKNSYNIEDELTKEDKNNLDKIYIKDINHVNNITKEYVDNLNVINNNFKYKIYKYNINDYIITTISLINIESFYNELDLLYGSRIISNNEVILILDNNNQLNKYDMSMIGINNPEYKYESLINYSYVINDITYTIKGIYRVKDDSILSDITGVIYNSEVYKDSIPDTIYLYPSSYDNKQVVINKLNEYQDIKYQDISTSIKSISNSLIDGISVVLLVFSIITLIVSSILISILTYINIMEYKHEIGIYKSIGLSNFNIQVIFYLENIIITCVSILISTITVLIISIPLNNYIYNLTGLINVISLNFGNFLLISFLSITLSVLSSSIPIHNISKLAIVEILRNE
ncbi:MAG: ATP-binding cassette domain-containing protein [Bacilli bacterium]|nr:ATP-binding cassette domain-containing protein [Bacilli bacterium]